MLQLEISSPRYNVTCSSDKQAFCHANWPDIPIRVFYNGGMNMNNISLSALTCLGITNSSNKPGMEESELRVVELQSLVFTWTKCCDCETSLALTGEH